MPKGENLSRVSDNVLFHFECYPFQAAIQLEVKLPWYKGITLKVAQYDIWYRVGMQLILRTSETSYLLCWSLWSGWWSWSWSSPTPSAPSSSSWLRRGSWTGYFEFFLNFWLKENKNPWNSLKLQRLWEKNSYPQVKFNCKGMALKLIWQGRPWAEASCAQMWESFPFCFQQALPWIWAQPPELQNLFLWTKLSIWFNN